MRIIIETIPHSEQRYPTVGDWYRNTASGDMEIRVSNLGDWRMDALIAVHELVEMLLCKHDGVTEEVVDAFDKGYVGEDEPGDHPAAPYRNQHCFATGVERMLAAALDVNWADYECTLEELD